MKNNIEYYPHDADAHNNPKFFTLRIKYGWGGEGMFWALNNLIAKSSECRLDVSSVMRKAPIADLFKMDFEQLEEFLQYVRTECQLIEYEDGIVTTSRLTDTYERVSAQREKARSRKGPKKPSSVEKGKSSGELYNKGKERKGKEKKGEGSTEATATAYQLLDDSEIEDLDSRSQTEPFKKSSAKKSFPQEGEDDALTPETAARRDAAIRNLSGQAAPEDARIVAEAAPADSAPGLVEPEFDLVNDTVEWLQNTYPGQNTWSDIRRYLQCADDELKDPTETVQAASILLGPARKVPDRFRRSLLGCAETQLKKDRREAQNKNNHGKFNRTTRNNQPAVTDETVVRVANELDYERVHGTSSLGF